MEKEFDVKVPLENTALLQQLAAESKKTGIAKSRLIVLYATYYVEMIRGGAFVPMVVGGDAGRAATNGHVEAKEAEVSLPSPSLDSDAIDTLFGDPD